MSTAYIVSNNQLIAAVSTDLRSGSVIVYARQSSADRLNANRESSLVNAAVAKISRSAKWAKAHKFNGLDTATEINVGEFLVK